MRISKARPRSSKRKVTLMPKSPDYQRGYTEGRALLHARIVALNGKIKALQLQRDQYKGAWEAGQADLVTLQAEFNAYKVTHP